ncbi:alpha/beta fold hydrolase (macronuclear) [Tetrahymena thermophila SB210]|uniref:Alpha/beta fold hydrolase n=1 Tax=Tetrahymena thermophila (strain SB210) TaxID=312017 RepID=A4VEU1_TETTS|nr:alpha/beta fold hydrolase [Tetrahymena thermophila SB210]EDK32044.1 alpha/beta fold hydrolase [Tetrahymena thermophila SB210]|eukprot:XP_001470716.1 alpha/beta fold hydrolase [Tetrahymena thermophila SB210]
MFSSLFGTKQLTPQEQKIINSQPYKALLTEDERKGYIKATLNETQIYKKCSLQPIIEDVKIRLDGSNQDLFIHTIKYPRKQTQQQSNEIPSILCLHGYGGTSLSYYKLSSLFQDSFDTYTIDFLGMGLSSHHEFHYTTINECIEYFVQSIEKWRIAKGINKLIIVGHSFGGYMGFNYAIRHQQRVVKLFLVSPLGGTKRTQEEVDLWFKKRQEESGYIQSQFFNYFQSAWHEKKTISRFFKMPLVPTYFMLNNYLKKRLQIEENLRSDWYDYMTGLIELPDSSDKAIFYLLRFPRMSAIHSIEEILSYEIKEMKKQFDFHIHFMYGDKDWMCSDGAKRIVEAKLTPSSFIVINDSTHNIVYDQPKQIHSYIMNNIN